MKFLIFVGIIFSPTKFLVNAAAVNENRQQPKISGAKTETENSGYTPDGKELYQGDMILTEEQKEWLEEEPDGLRKAINDQNYRWPDAIVPFRLSDSSENDRQAILRGMALWIENSCISFEEVGENYEAPHLIFHKFGGCFSAVGRTYMFNGQTISIGSGCTGTGTVAHEIGHALGFHHEQSRPDRDRYVVVLDQNINKMKKNNFRVDQNINDYGIPYDLGSIMHYGPDGFTVNGRNTLVTKDPFKHFLIGQREKLSFADLKLAHHMYNCSSKCGNNKCLNGGYMDKYCECKCPPEYVGNICEHNVQIPPYLTCGSSINAPTTITSPYYPRNYPENSKCVWVVTAPPDHKVRVNFQEFRTAKRLKGNNWCTFDFLEVRSQDLFNGERYCGIELDQNSLTSEGQTMVLLFSSQTSYYPGFQADIEFVQ